MHRKLTLMLLSLVIFSVVARAADDRLSGTWKLNLTKSKFSAGFPIPKTQSYRYEPSGTDGLTFTNDTMEADGSSTHALYTAKYDGKDYPVTGDPTRDMTSVKRLDAYTSEGVTKNNGKVSGRFKRVVSKNGQVLTITSKGTLNGKAYNNVAVYDKQ